MNNLETISNVKLTYNADSPLNGAFTYLKSAYNKDNISNEIVKISAKTSDFNLEYPVVKRDIGKDYWRSSNENGSWYEVDFLLNHFYLESYVIRAYYIDFFESWQVLGSNDGKKYDVVDDVKGFEKPDENIHNLNFKCKYPKVRRTFRIVASGKRFKGCDYYFHIYRLEFFGRFVGFDQNKRRTCNQRRYNGNTFVYCLLVLCSC